MRLNQGLTEYNATRSRIWARTQAQTEITEAGGNRCAMYSDADTKNGYEYDKLYRRQKDMAITMITLDKALSQV